MRERNEGELLESARRACHDSHAKSKGPELAFRAACNLRLVPYCCYALERYAPSAVSTRILSPSLMNGGTCTTRPVSVLAGLVTLDAVALLMPGSVSSTVRSTVCGSSTPTALPSKNSMRICMLVVR